MLYINGELISTSNKNPNYAFADVVKDYHSSLKKAQDYYGEFLNIETRVRPRRDAKTRAFRYPGPRGISLVSTIKRNLEGGGTVVEEMRYSPTMLRKNDDGSFRHDSPNLLVHKGVFSFKIQDNPDLAYYLLKCGKVGLTPAEGKKFHIYDVKQMNKDNHARRKLQGQVLNLIYTSLPEDRLRTLAKSFGVPDVNLKDIETVREELFSKLEQAESIKAKKVESSVRGFNEFVESAEVKMHDQITALCVDARDSESLVFNEEERRWEIDYKDGGTPYVLKELSGNEYGDPLGSLVSFLLSSNKSLRKLEAVMGLATKEKPIEKPVETKDEERVEITPEMILKEHKVPVLKKWLRQIDPNIEIKQTAKLQQLREELLKRIPAE